MIQRKPSIRTATDALQRSTWSRRMACAVVAMATLTGAAAWAQASTSDYPNRPIKLVIPFPAGGSSDGIGR